MHTATTHESVWKRRAQTNSSSAFPIAVTACKTGLWQTLNTFTLTSLQRTGSRYALLWMSGLTIILQKRKLRQSEEPMCSTSHRNWKKNYQKQQKEVQGCLNPTPPFWSSFLSPLRTPQHVTQTHCRPQSPLLCPTAPLSSQAGTHSTQPSLPWCWQPGTSGLLKCGPVFQGQSDLPPGDQTLTKVCKCKTQFWTSDRDDLWNGWGGCEEQTVTHKSDFLQQQSLHRLQYRPQLLAPRPETSSPVRITCLTSSLALLERTACQS